MPLSHFLLLWLQDRAANAHLLLFLVVAGLSKCSQKFRASQIQLPPGVCCQVSASGSILFCAVFGAFFLHLITECLIGSLLALNAIL